MFQPFVYTLDFDYCYVRTRPLITHIVTVALSQCECRVMSERVR